MAEKKKKEEYPWQKCGEYVEESDGCKKATFLAATEEVVQCALNKRSIIFPCPLGYVRNGG